MGDTKKHTHEPTADDGEFTPEAIAALDEADEWSKHNQATPHAQVLTELGITQADIENYKESK